MDKAPYEGTINSVFARWIVILAVAVLVLLNCEIGRILGLNLTGLKISIFWPAAGISLAALLLLGTSIWPGVFLGNLLYNLPHLLAASNTVTLPVIIGTIVSLGSALQAWLGATIIKGFSTPRFFNNLKDVFVFLVPAGFFTCLIGASIGVPALVLGGFVPPDQGWFTWLTFWFGDTTGVYIITPLILVWFTYEKIEWTWQRVIEAAVILMVLLVVSYFTFYQDVPLTSVILPLVLWVAFRFGARGATLMMFAVSTLALVATWQEQGIFSHAHFVDPLLVLVSFICVVTGTALIVAGTLNERQDAWRLLQNYNKNLEDTVSTRTKQLNEIHDAFNVKQKLISLGMLTAGIGHEIKTPLSHIRQYAEGGEDCLKILKEIFRTQRQRMDVNGAVAMENTLETLNNCMTKIMDHEKQANHIVDVIIQTATADKKVAVEIKSINLHVLINKTLEQVKQQMELRFPELHIDVHKEYAPSIGMIDCIPEDLARVFFQIIDNSWFALKQKKDKLGNAFTPLLTVRTVDKRDQVEIIIQDNGIGIPAHLLTKVFQPFFTTKPTEEGTGLGMAIIHDIVVQEHHGNIAVDSKENDYTEIRIRLPKSRSETALIIGE